MSATDLLDRIQIKKPCDSDWDSMIGNDQVRFCEHCALTVHDLSQMTRKRARRLVAKSNGRLCVRYTRCPDGSLVTKAVPQKLFRIGRRASRIAASAFSATLSLSGAITVNAGERSNVYQGNAVLVYQDRSQQVYTGSTVVGTLTDARGAVISGAIVSLSNDQSQVSLITSSNSEGEYRFEGLAPGAYSLRIEATGFEPVESQMLYLAASNTRRADRRLEVATIREEVQIQAPTQASDLATTGVVATELVEPSEQIQAPIQVSDHAFTGLVAIELVEPSEPLIKAAQKDEFLEMLAVLTRENVNVRDKATGTTALEHAVRNGNREMLQALISVGADVNSRNDLKETVLMMLGSEATADMVWDLIHAGAKLDLKDNDGDTALIEAAMVNNFSVLQALLQAGAKVNIKNDEGQTALMLAASNDMIKNVKALIVAGADMNARDNKGRTVLNYAKEEDNENIVKLLQSYGAVEGTPQEDR